MSEGKLRHDGVSSILAHAVKEIGGLLVVRPHRPFLSILRNEEDSVHRVVFEISQFYLIRRTCVVAHDVRDGDALPLVPVHAAWKPRHTFRSAVDEPAELLRSLA